MRNILLYLTEGYSCKLSLFQKILAQEQTVYQCIINDNDTNWKQQQLPFLKITRRVKIRGEERQRNDKDVSSQRVQ
jgi:hypothetical protein